MGTDDLSYQSSPLSDLSLLLAANAVNAFPAFPMTTSEPFTRAASALALAYSPTSRSSSFASSSSRFSGFELCGCQHLADRVHIPGETRDRKRIPKMALREHSAGSRSLHRRRRAGSSTSNAPSAGSSSNTSSLDARRRIPLPFQKTDRVRYAVLGRDAHTQVDVVRLRVAFYQFYSSLLTKLSKNSPHATPKVPI